ncbi:MAG: hypothetical protein WA364_17550 [Candidatus Nitrosopolaris sp.]
MNVNEKVFYKGILGVSVVLILTIAIPATTVLAASPGYLTIKTAKVSSGALDALLQTNGNIPKDGSGGAFGYGIITKAGDNAVIVATTNGDIRDSATQGSGSGPIWHNQIARLAVVPGGLCGSDKQVTAMTFEQPGIVYVKGSQVSIAGIPSSFTGTDSITGNPLTLSPGNNVQKVISFVLDPKPSSQDLKALCVKNMTTAEHVFQKGADTTGSGLALGGSDSGGIS